MNNRVSLESRKLECIKHVKAVEKRRLDLINKKKVVWINQWKCCHNILTHKRIYKHYTLMHKNTQTHIHTYTHTHTYIYIRLQWITPLQIQGKTQRVNEYDE